MVPLHTVRKRVLQALCLFFLITGLGLDGCRCGKNSGAEYQDPEKSALAFRGDKQREVPTTDDPYCPNPTKFENPGKEEMLYPLAEAYKAALMDDSDAGFVRFDAQFEGQSRADQQHRKRNLWPRIRQHVAKYIPDPEKFSFEVCKEEKKTGGDIRITVRSHVATKRHPPSRLRQVDGVWKIHVFSY